MTQWDLQEIRSTWFKTSAPELRADELFTRVFRVDPDQVIRNKAPNPGQPFLSRADGEVAGVPCQIQVQPGRVDLFGRGKTPDSPSSSDVPIQGGLGYLEQFGEYVSALCGEVGVATRIALAPTLKLPTKGANEAATFILGRVLPKIDIPDGRDASFQLNRPRAFGTVDGHIMNRVCRLDTTTSQWFVMQASPLVDSPPTVASSPQVFVTFTLDLNNSPNGFELESGQQRTMFVELADEARQLAEARDLVAYLAD